MNRYFLLFFLWAIFSPMVLASNSGVINVFYLGSNICGPVCIKCSSGTFYVNNGDQVEGNLMYMEAFDCSGNKILDVSPDETQYSSGRGTTRIYRFEYLYPNSGTEETESGGYISEDSYSSGSNYGDATSDLATNVATGLTNLMSSQIYISVGGYPYGSLSVGTSRFYGEFARLNILLGGKSGFSIFGGVGKGWLFDGENKDKMAWHVGFGGYISWGWDSWEESTQAFRLDIGFGESPIVFNKGMVCDFVYEHFFGETQRFGVFGGVGFSLGDFKAKDPVIDWNIQAGVSVKLWRH